MTVSVPVVTPPVGAGAVDRLVPLRGGDHEDVLCRAVEVRRRGGIPLVGDERWTDGHWDTVVSTVRTGLARAAATEAAPLDRADWASFTSGSTGTPRVVLRSHDSWSVSFPQVGRLLGSSPGDRLLVPVHPVSSMALYSAAWAHDAGLDLAIPETSRLRPVDLTGGRSGRARTVPAPTVLHGTPWHLREVVEMLESGVRSPLRAALIGGALLDPGLAARARALGLRVATYFGAAELSFVAADTGAGLRAFPNTSLQVRGGRLWVRSRQLALGTLDADALRLLDTDAEGWATVGDRALLEDGVLTPLGRADEAIQTAGATVVPADVEAALEQAPGVAAALVLGIPDRALGERVLAVVEPRPDTPLDVGGLRRWARRHLAPAQRPRAWRLVRALPRTGSGKVQRLSAPAALELAPAGADTVEEAPGTGRHALGQPGEGDRS